MSQRKTWITSDPHFFHKNICKYAGRPFTGYLEMNLTIQENWNKVVGKDDIVYLLGDVTFTNFEYSQRIISKLNGTIILIRGNHDKRHSDDWFLKCGISKVYRHSIILDDWFILSHRPVYVSNEMPYVNIHGHIHEKLVDSPSHFNACVEHHDYTPVLFNDIKKQFKGMVGDETLLKHLEDIHNS